MDLAVIIVSYNVRDLLRSCLRSLFQSLGRQPALHSEVWVVDNASADGSAEMVRCEFPQVHLLASQTNLGFAAGNNLALRRLQDEAQYLLLLNPDTEIQDNALGQMVAFLDTYPLAGGCGARLSFPDGRFQHSAFRFPGLAQVALDFFPPPGRLNRPILESRWNGRYSRQLYEGGHPFPVDFVLGATLMVRAVAVRQVGLLDEGYFMYCEEMDWQQRLQQAGWPMYCVPTAHVIHHGGASTSQFRATMFVALWRSRLRYFRRHRGAGFNWLANRLIRLGIQAEALRARRSATSDLADRLAAYAEVKRLTASLAS